MPHRSVIPLDIGVLCWLARLDVHQRYFPAVGPIHQRLRYVLGPIIQANCTGLATPLDNLLKATYYTAAWQRQVNLNSQPFPVIVVQYVKRAQ